MDEAATRCRSLRTKFFFTPFYSLGVCSVCSRGYFYEWVYGGGPCPSLLGWSSSAPRWPPQEHHAGVSGSDSLSRRSSMIRYSASGTSASYLVGSS